MGRESIALESSADKIGFVGTGQIMALRERGFGLMLQASYCGLLWREDAG